MTNFNNATDLVNMEPMGSYTDEMKQFVDAEGLHQYSAQTCEMFERFYDTVQEQMTDDKILVQKLAPYAKVPNKRSITAAGFDLFSCEDISVKPQSTVTIDTSIAMHIPLGYCGRIVETSEVAEKHGLITLGGMIDNDYTVAIRIVIHNLNNHTVPIVRGCKVAQIIIERIYDGHEIQVVKHLTPNAQQVSKDDHSTQTFIWRCPRLSPGPITIKWRCPS